MVVSDQLQTLVALPEGQSPHYPQKNQGVEPFWRS